MIRRAVLITGAAGFLGRHLAAECAAAGDAVWGLDRRAPAGAAETFAGFFVAPIRDFADVLASQPFEECYHLAGSASVPFSVAEPQADWEKLLPDTLRLILALARARPGCRTVVYSSAAVYGNPASLPVREEHAAAPISPYGIHKLTAETLWEHYARNYGLPVAILRIFSAYGRGLRKQLFWDVLQKVAASPTREITLLGTGEETRDFVHGRDVARAARNVCAEMASAAAPRVNVASGQETTIREAVNLLLGSTARVAFSGVNRPGDPLRWRADVSALAALGWSPQVALRDGLADFRRFWAEEAAR